MSEERTIAVGYQLKAVCLVVHEVTCSRCKTEFRASQGTMLRLQKADASIYVSPKIATGDLSLPHEKRVVRTTVDACEACFKEGKGEVRRDEFTLLDRRVGGKNDLFLRPRKVEDIEFRQAGDAINRTSPQRHRGRPKADPKPEVALKDMF